MMKNSLSWGTWAFTFCLVACSSAKPEEGRNPDGSGGGIGATGGLGVTGGTTAGTGGTTQATGGQLFGTTGGQFIGTTGGASGVSSGICASAELAIDVESSPGNLLVLFDRSSSMERDFEGQTRLAAVDGALVQGLTPFVCQPTAPDEDPCIENLTVASLMFPSPVTDFVTQLAERCIVNPVDAPTQIPWQPVGDFVNSWAAYWGGTFGGVIQGTPIPRVFQRAEEALQASTLPGSTAVLFLTDGGTSCDASEGLEPVAQAAAWLQRGIKTYVVSVQPGGSRFNDQVAAAGGTGQSITPTDTQALTQVLGSIISETSGALDCTVTTQGRGIGNFDLACNSGTVTIDRNPIACDPVDGFQITDANEFKFFGRACAALSKATSTVEAEFPCDALLE